MRFLIFLSLLALSCALDPTTVFDSNGISLWEKMEEMERLILNNAAFNQLVNPCDFDAGGNPFQETQQSTAAQWVRIVFHDVITKNIEGPGLGGLDASIGYEADRPENIGEFVNATLAQFRINQNVFLSMSDIIALGIADALANCANDHRRLPLRVGRIDATRAGPAGVPGPSDGFTFALNAFKRAGFSQQEMIQAVACGHSLGGVHGIDFPDIGAVSTDDNTSGRLTFDSTPGAFDNVGVTEYLSGTTANPLVVGHNVTERSDFQIFSSDGNATVKAMSSATAFENTCFTIFEKMVNTVPDAVTLSDTFAARPWSMDESHLDLNSDGTVRFQGTITAWSIAGPPDTASYQYNTQGGGNTGPKSSQSGVTLQGFSGPFQVDDPSVIAQLGFGVIKQYSFSDNLFANPVTSISITNTGSTYVGPINTNIFILPSQSFTQVGTGTGIFQVRVAILRSVSTTTSAPVVKIWYPIAQQLTESFQVVSRTATLQFEKTLGAYNIYKGSNFLGSAPFAPTGIPVFQVKFGSLASAKISSNIFEGACQQPNISDC